MILRSPRLLVSLALLAAAAGGLSAARAEGLYLGGSLAAPDYGSPVNGIGGDGNHGRGPGLKLYAGYALTPQFAVEGGLFTLGRLRDDTGHARVGGMFIDGVGRYALAPQWSLLGSVGLAQARLQTSAGDDGSPALKLGLGVEYALNAQVSLRAQYDHYRFASAFDAKPTAGAYSLGVKVGF